MFVDVFQRYASEVDVDFVRKSIRAIGQTAVKIDAAAEKCVNVLLELIATRVSYVVQEAVVVMKVGSLQGIIIPCANQTQDIFRKYPSTYEGVIPTLCANLDELDEPEAKASLIWIIGEYASKIDNADELLAIFVDSFTEESYQVGKSHRRSFTIHYEMQSGSITDFDGSGEAILGQARLVAKPCTACP